MGSMFTDEQDTIHIHGQLTIQVAHELHRMVNDAFRLHEAPVTTLTLAFDEASDLADDAIDAMRGALGDALAVCAERNAALRIIPSPGLRRLANDHG
ncbi:hypothetical protein [Actinoplanes sp. NPDC049265]|uniref:hypothetical protein n=1 Tax=Actinoplanes sp. NPDC049265 TaxID=3363902 RepID=UPI003714606A